MEYKLPSSNWAYVDEKPENKLNESAKRLSDVLKETTAINDVKRKYEPKPGDIVKIKDSVTNRNLYGAGIKRYQVNGIMSVVTPHIESCYKTSLVSTTIHHSLLHIPYKWLEPIGGKSKFKFKVGDVIKSSIGIYDLIVCKINNDMDCYHLAKCEDRINGSDYTRTVPRHIVDKQFELVKQ